LKIAGSLQFHRWTRTAIAIAVLVYAATLSLSSYFPALDSKLVILIVGFIFLGIPHGAMDIFLAQRAIKKNQMTRSFLIKYLALTFGVMVLWTLTPTAAFLFFICYSLFHFADSDLQRPILESKLSILEFLARFPLPFCLPLLFQPTETLLLVQYLDRDIRFWPFVTYFQWMGYAGLGLTGAFTVIKSYSFLKNFGKEDLTFLEPVVMAVVFAMIDPLYALGIYFCFIHSVKHIINLITKIEIHSIQVLLPYWLIPVLGVFILFISYTWVGDRGSIGFQIELFQYMILSLAALAFPHALLVRSCKRRGAIN
jgi:Brp/Blh family beta-carotene 15,15'-monooxygenase